MKYTSNLQLRKPDGSDIVDIDDLNFNADKIDQEISNRVKKVQNLNSGYNLNNLTDTGFYIVQNPNNAPSGISDWCYVVNIPYSSNYTLQLLAPFSSNRVFYRRKYSSWQEWNELPNKSDILNELAKKVDKVAGKQLSTEDYTTEEKNKLAGIEAGANKYIHPPTHPASMIEESTDKQFVSASEKASWNAKETPAGAQAKVDAHATRKDNPHNVTVTQIGAETPSGAQQKANIAENNAKQYAQTLVNNHLQNYDNPHLYKDQSNNTDYKDLKYKLIMKDGKPYMEVVE